MRQPDPQPASLDDAAPEGPAAGKGPRSPRSRWILASAGAVAIVGLGWGAARLQSYSESIEFCGLACHRAMSPQYRAHVAGSHAQVPCAACHIGESTMSHVLAKVRGVRQLWAMTQDSFVRPVRSLHALPEPMRERCQKCHSLDQLPGTKQVHAPRLGYGASNPIQLLTLTLKIGSEDGHMGKSGIGWHMAMQSRIEFAATDPTAREIPWVQVRRPDGSETTYVSSASKLSRVQMTQLPRRSMDCTDCHNRTAHGFPLPDPAIDQALRNGEFSLQLPNVKRLLVEALTVEYRNAEEARRRIREYLTMAVEKSHPQLLRELSPELERAVEFAMRLYERSVHDAQGIEFGSYVNHLGHRFSSGCFRCHDGLHVSGDGKVITNDCGTSCHGLPSMGQLLADGKIGQNATQSWHPFLLPILDLNIPGHDRLTCPDCHGAGRVPRRACDDCHRPPGI